MVSSDHSPAPPEDKLLEEGDFLRAWGGISSLQFSLPATWTQMSKLGMDFVKLAGETSSVVAPRAHLSRHLLRSYPRVSLLPCEIAVFSKRARRMLDFFRTPPRNTVEPSPLKHWHVVVRKAQKPCDQRNVFCHCAWGPHFSICASFKMLGRWLPAFLF